MSGKFMKGFLIFAVVFFFVVVGLVGLTVVMKPHENAQIVEEDKTLVAPDPQKIQRLVNRIEFDKDMSEMDKVNARIAVTALLKACPRIVNLASVNTSLKGSYSGWVPEWKSTKAYFDLMIDFKKDNFQNRPDRFKQEKGLAEYGLVGGMQPGALVIWPFDRWLCNLRSNMNNKEMNDALDKEEVTYKDLMQFIPLKDIPPNSF